MIDEVGVNTLIGLVLESVDSEEATPQAWQDLIVTTHIHAVADHYQEKASKAKNADRVAEFQFLSLALKRFADTMDEQRTRRERREARKARTATATATRPATSCRWPCSLNRNPNRRKGRTNGHVLTRRRWAKARRLIVCLACAFPLTYKHTT